MRRVSEAPDFWVPEDHMFETGEECLEAFPDQAAAAGWNGDWQRRFDAAMIMIADMVNNREPRPIMEKSFSMGATYLRNNGMGHLLK